jgi:histidinol-phosphatase (PHP family)
MEELPGYVSALDRAILDFPELLILKGMECEFVPEFVPFYREVLLEQYGFHYLISGAHWYPHEGDWAGLYGTVMTPGMLRSYTAYLVQCIESGLYSFIAHPDLFGVCYREWDRHAHAAATEICRAAAGLDLPLEINAYGFRKPYVEVAGGERAIYPWAPFWEVAATWDTPVVVNSDAHRPQDILANTRQGCELAESLGLRQVRLEAAEKAAGAE